MTRRAIVLDANILVRAVLGERVRRLIMDHAKNVSFFAPDAAFAEAREHLPVLLATWTTGRVKLYLAPEDPAGTDEDSGPQNRP